MQERFKAILFYKKQRIIAGDTYFIYTAFALSDYTIRVVRSKILIRKHNHVFPITYIFMRLINFTHFIWPQQKIVFGAYGKFEEVSIALLQPDGEILIGGNNYDETFYYPSNSVLRVFSPYTGWLRINYFTDLKEQSIQKYLQHGVGFRKLYWK